MWWQRRQCLVTLGWPQQFPLVPRLYKPSSPRGTMLHRRPRPGSWKRGNEERMRRPISGVPFLFCFAGVSPSALDGTADVVKRIASSPQQQAADNPNQPKHRKQQPRQPKAMKGEKRSPQQTPAADSAATKRPSKGPQDQHQRSRPQEGKRPRPTELQRTSAARAIEDETATIPTPRQPQPAGPHTASTRSSRRASPSCQLTLIIRFLQNSGNSQVLHQ